MTAAEPQHQQEGAVEQVRHFLRQLENGEVSIEDAGRIRDELRELVTRVERMNKLFPDQEGPELSSDVRNLFEQIDRNKLVDRFPFLKQAASFL